VGGDPNRRDIQEYSQLVAQVNTLEAGYHGLSDEALRAKTAEFRARLAQGESLDDLLPEAFGVVREASQRTLGLRHFDVQLIGGMVLHEGRVAEMRTGEGKTLVATLPLYLNSLAGRGAHLITVNDYLARRDARWMGPIYALLGLTVGVLQEASRTDNARKAFVYDAERTSPQEDVHQLRLVDRREAYAADLTYGTNHEFGFDYLRDNLTLRRDERVQRVRNFAIVDEVDNILIDEARTPLIISGPAAEDPQEYLRMAQSVRQLRPDDYEIDERDRTVTLTEVGDQHAEQILGLALRDPDRPEDVTPEQARLIGHLQQALRAEYLFKRNKDYLVQAGQVIIVDEFTGRLMHGRRWSDGLHQAVEAKEGLQVQAENVTYATITLQNYFRLYTKLAGMTGTALTEAEEFSKIYKLEVVPIPTHLEHTAAQPESTLVEVPYKENGDRFFYFARKDDPALPVFWRRKDHADVVFRTEEAKLRAICTEILQMNALGRPVLVGTTSVERSEMLSERLHTDPLRRLALTLLLRDTWFERHNAQEDGRLIEDLEFLNQPLTSLTPAALRPAARELEMSLNPEAEENVDRLGRVLELPPEARPRLLEILARGIPHQVLNAKRHAEESQIIASAGAFGSVTIATNMAGRGVDIKLGGDLAEEVLAAVNRVLRRSGTDNPYDLSHAQRLAALDALPPEKLGIYATEIGFFRMHMQEEARVRVLGGLHIVGSERHEARRIDNQLRGRAARQGDPGSSRFYLSLEDDLMRRFGGSQVSDLMQRMRIDDAVPMAMNLVSRLIEQAQTRVEGANFDVRKHLLEYDDVLNTQRNKIYEQRERVFEKEDLTEDIRTLLEAEVKARVEAGLKEDEGPWRLLAWLDEIQPPLARTGGGLYPSFTLRTIADSLKGQDPVDPKELTELATRAMDAEAEHLLAAFDQQAEQVTERAESQARERRQAAETAIEGAELEARDAEREFTPQTLVAAVGQSLAIEVKDIPREHMLPQAMEALKGDVADLAERGAWARAADQLAFWLQRRTGLAPAKPAEAGADFDKTVEALQAQLQSALEARRRRVLAEVERELAAPEAAGLERTRLLLQMTLATQTVFDARTHQRRTVTSGRFNWVYQAAALLADQKLEAVTDDVQEHLLGAMQAVREEWGEQVWQRQAEDTLPALPEALRAELETDLAEAGVDPAGLADRPLREWPAEARAALVSGLGGYALSQAYRDLMLTTIGQLWVEYLTSMEGLRTSIGLEAYAQRDPLVQYKSRAFDLYRQLLDQVRAGIVARVFRMRLAPPGAGGTAAAPGTSPSGRRAIGRNDPCWCGSGKKYKDCHWEADQPKPESAAPAAPEPRGVAHSEPQPAAGPVPAGGKRKRHRH
jgi:preprotein translocase subunit SecA